MDASYAPRIQLFLKSCLIFLLFVWSIKGITAIRNTALFCVILSTSWLYFKMPLTRRRTYSNKVYQSPPLIWLGVLLLWWGIQLLFFAHEPLWSLHEWRSQWGFALCIGITGWLLGHCGRFYPDLRPKKLMTSILQVMLLFALCGIASWGIEAIRTHTLPFGHIPFVEWKGFRSGKLEFSYMITLNLALLSVDYLHTKLNRPRLSDLSLKAIGWGIFVCLVALFLAGARNGLVGCAFLLISSGIVWGLAQPNQQRLVRAALGMSIGFFVFLWAIFHADPRWTTLLETLPLALDIDTHRGWLTRDNFPLLSNGMPVNGSNYERMAWITVGIRLVFEHYPLGYGFGREVFAHALYPIYGGTAGGHSHSGYIDLMLSGGFPALILWLLYTFSVLKKSLTAYKATHAPYALLLFFVVAGFNGRLILDSIGRDHFLQIHFFFSGLLLAWIDSHDKISHHSAR